MRTTRTWTDTLSQRAIRPSSLTWTETSYGEKTYTKLLNGASIGTELITLTDPAIVVSKWYNNITTNAVQSTINLDGYWSNWGIKYMYELTGTGTNGYTDGVLIFRRTTNASTWNDDGDNRIGFNPNNSDGNRWHDIGSGAPTTVSKNTTNGIVSLTDEHTGKVSTFYDPHTHNTDGSSGGDPYALNPTSNLTPPIFATFTESTIGTISFDRSTGGKEYWTRNGADAWYVENDNGVIKWNDVLNVEPWKFNFMQSTSQPSIIHGNGHIEDITNYDGWYIHFFTFHNNYTGYAKINIIYEPAYRTGTSQGFAFTSGTWKGYGYTAIIDDEANSSSGKLVNGVRQWEWDMPDIGGGRLYSGANNWIYFVPGTAEDNGTWYHSSTSTGGTAGTRNGRVISIGTSATFDETNAFVDGLVPYGDIP